MSFRRLHLVLFLTACATEVEPDARQMLPGQPAKPDAREADAPVPVVPDAPPPPAPDAMPAGPATVILNELSPNFAAQHDLVELLATAGGTLDGIQLVRDYPHAPVVLATLPDVVVTAGAVVVVHMVPDADLRPFFAGAVNVRGGDSDIPFTNVVLAIRGADGKVSSAVPFTRSDLPNDPDVLPAAFPADVQALVDAGLWLSACAPAPCAYGGNIGAVTVDWATAGTGADPATADGASIQRLAGHDHREVADWTRAAAAPWNSYGSTN